MQHSLLTFSARNTIVFTEKCEAESYLARAFDEAVSFKNRVSGLVEREAGSIDSVVRQIKAERYDTDTGVKQPETTCLLNFKAQVIHLARKHGCRMQTKEGMVVHQF